MRQAFEDLAGAIHAWLLEKPTDSRQYPREVHQEVQQIGVPFPLWTFGVTRVKCRRELTLTLVRTRLNDVQCNVRSEGRTWPFRLRESATAFSQTGMCLAAKLTWCSRVRCSSWSVSVHRESETACLLGCERAPRLSCCPL